MKLTVKLLLLIFVDLFLLISVDQVWFDASLKVVKNSETTTTSSTTTVTKTFDNDTKNKLNDASAKNVKPNVLKVSDNVTKNKVNDNNNDGRAPNVLKVSPPKLQQFLPSVWMYTTAHREVPFCF